MDGIVTQISNNLTFASDKVRIVADTVTTMQDDAAALSDWLLVNVTNDLSWQALLQKLQADINSLADTGILPPAPPPQR